MKANLSAAAVAVVCLLLLLAVRWITDPPYRLTRFELRLIGVFLKAKAAFAKAANNVLKRR